jgi:hypothetical protein
MAITKPYTFQAGTKARASEVNQDFDILYSEVNRIGTEILNIDIDIQNVAEGKADINGDAGQVFKMADAVDSYDGVNKNFLENSIANIKDYISGYVITKNTNNSIRVSSGSCYDSAYTVVINSTGNITKENTIQGAGTRYIHAISDSSGRQVDILISSQSISPALPSGYTKYRLIGSFVTDSSNNIISISYFGNASNVDKNINVVTGIVTPDYSRGISTTAQTYIAPYDGVYYASYAVNEQKPGYVYVNGREAGAYWDYEGEGGMVTTPFTVVVSKGDVISWTSAGVRFGRFYPMKGSV